MQQIVRTGGNDVTAFARGNAYCGYRISPPSIQNIVWGSDYKYKFFFQYGAQSYASFISTITRQRMLKAVELISAGKLYENPRWSFRDVALQERPIFCPLPQEYGAVVV